MKQLLMAVALCALTQPALAQMPRKPPSGIEVSIVSMKVERLMTKAVVQLVNKTKLNFDRVDLGCVFWSGTQPLERKEAWLYNVEAGSDDNVEQVAYFGDPDPRLELRCKVDMVWD